jgi:hypothetical protein
MRGRRAPVVGLLALTLLIASGCAAPKTIETVWPVATSERTIDRPNGSPQWPLTGLDAPSADAVQTRIVSVKIENSPAARPQTGLDKADIVYETLTEGGITRFNALFQSQSPKAVGPVRSARPSDFAIVQQYQALFAHCGGDPQVRKELADKTRFDDMDQFYNAAPYWRAKDRAAPHNLYVAISTLRSEAILKRGYAATAAVQGFTFVHADVATTPTVKTLTVAFSASNKVTWRYDAATRLYRRSINGVPQLDRASHKQYSARNVVVLWTTVRRYTASHNSQLQEIALTGGGRLSVFRDGQRFDGTWEAGTDGPPVLRGPDGRVIGLDAGNTWFQVIGNDQDIVMK